MKTLTAAEIAEFNRLTAAYEARWAELGAEKRADLNFHDAEIDRLAHAQFLIISGGADVIVIPAEDVIAMAEPEDLVYTFEAGHVVCNSDRK